MKQILLFSSLFFLLQFSASAQEYVLPKWQLSVAFFGESLTHSGVRIGLTTPIGTQATNDRGSHKAWVVGGYLSYYRHQRNHTGLMLTGSIGRQRIGETGFQTCFNLEGGYMLSRLDGEVYQWDGTGVEAGNQASSHFVFGLNGGAGWNFDRNTSLPLSVMVQPHLYLQAPYNTFAVPRWALDLKLAYFL